MISHHFNLLKNLVIDVANLSNFTSSDCKVLSTLIYQKTKKRLSETTLKRVYGFAYSKFNSSLFTLDTLSQYCNYDNWSTFLAEYESEPGSGKSVNWLNLSNEATKVTKFSSRVLINRSGIPYKKTIKRKFIDDHLTGFLASDCIATVLTAPAGYGKTVALLHWLEEKQEANAAENNNDIILFFSTPALMSVLSSGQDIYLWLLSLLGYNRSEISELLLSNTEDAPGKFYLIIDGLDEHMFKNDQFQLVLNQIIDILSLYQSSSVFKLIITMRSNTWNNNKHHFGDEKNWFPGFMNLNNNVNVPLFNLQEVHELCNKITTLTKVTIDAEAMDILSFPLYFQIYYKLNAPTCAFNNIGRLSKYEIISAFILDKIYLDKYSSEKILLLFELIGMMDLKSGSYSVNKLKADELIVKYNYVYNELMSLEFLREYNKSVDLQPNTYIEFGHPDFLEYFIAQKLLTDNDNRFNPTLIDQAEQLLNNNYKLNVVKWFLIYAIKTDQQYSLSHIFKIELPINKKADLIVFIGDIFEKGYISLTPKISIKQYFKFSLENEDFDYFFGLEYISTEYEKTLLTLLRFDLTNDKKILLLCSLAIISITKLDMKGLEDHLTALKKIPNMDFFKYPINPLNCLNTIFYYLKYGIVKKEAFIEITKFCFNPPDQESAFKKTITNDLMYLFATYTLQIAQNPSKQLLFISILNKRYQSFSKFSNEYMFFLKIAIADGYYMLDDKKNLLLTYRSILKSSYNFDSYTPYMNVVYHALKIKIALANQQYSTIDYEYKHFASIADEHNFKLAKFYMGSIILKSGALVDDLGQSQFYKQLHYEHSKLMIEGKVTEIFEKQEKYKNHNRTHIIE